MNVMYEKFKNIEEKVLSLHRDLEDLKQQVENCGEGEANSIQSAVNFINNADDLVNQSMGGVSQHPDYQLFNEIINSQRWFRFRDIDTIMKDHNVQHFSKQRFLGTIDVCIKHGLIEEPERPQKNQSIYFKEHILFYLFISALERILSDKEVEDTVKILGPRIRSNGVVDFYEEYISTAILFSEIMNNIIPYANREISGKSEGETEEYDIYTNMIFGQIGLAIYTHRNIADIVARCMKERELKHLIE
jgi:hypothetical protein